MARNRNNRINIMLSDDEYKKLINDITKAQISKSNYIRKLILNKKINEKPDNQFYDMMIKINKIEENLNKIVYKANYLNDINKDYYKEQVIIWNEFMIDIKNRFL